MITVTRTADGGRTFSVGENTADARRFAGIAQTAAASTAADAAATAADRAATAADRAETANDRAYTSADRTATAADRVATGADRAETANDRAYTSADRTATAADRAAVAADRVQTGNDSASAVAAKDAALAALTTASPLRYGSIQFPDENGEALVADPQNTGQFFVQNSTAGTLAGGTALWSGDSSAFVIWDCPTEAYLTLNRTPFLFGGSSNANINRNLALRYNAKGQTANPATHSLTFFVRGDVATWTVDTGLVLPLTVSRMGILAVRSGDSMQIDVLDLETGTWYAGAPVAKPANFVGTSLLTSGLQIGSPAAQGVFTNGQPDYYDNRDGSHGAQLIPWIRGAMRDFVLADRALSHADIEAIVAGADVVAQVGAAQVRLHAPLVDANGQPTLAVTSNRAGVGPLRQDGTVFPGPTLKRQAAAKYLTLDRLKYPGFVARETGASSAPVQLTGKAAGLSGTLQVRMVDRTGRIVRDWHQVAYTLAGTALSFTCNVPCPVLHGFQLQARFTSDPAVVAATHSNLQAGPVVALWSQSEGYYSTFGSGGINKTGTNTVLNVKPEGDTGTVNWALPDGSVAYTRLRPGFLGDMAINIANYLRRRTHEPVLIVSHMISGTGLRDLMDDTQTGRQWAAETAGNAFPLNRGANGEFVVTGHVKIGWEANDNVTEYSRYVNAPWYQGKPWGPDALSGIASLDHWLYDGTMSQSAVAIELPCNRATLSDAASSATTDASTEADQRDSQRNWGHRLGYRIGPPQVTHKMEGEVAAGNKLPAGSATHPEANDWEGALEMSFGNAEAIAMAIGAGSYPGAVFFESIRPGSAANKVIVTLGNPRPYPGEGLANPDVGYTTAFQRAPVPSAVKLRTKKAGGNPRWAFEAKIDNAGAWSLANVVAATIVNPREVELTLAANAVAGQTAVRHQPGSPGSYKSTTVSQEDWRSGQLFFTGMSWTAGREIGFAVSGSNQALVLP